jgi:hypothetical protein
MTHCPVYSEDHVFPLIAAHRRRESSSGSTAPAVGRTCLSRVQAETNLGPGFFSEESMTKLDKQDSPHESTRKVEIGDTFHSASAHRKSRKVSRHTSPIVPTK